MPEGRIRKVVVNWPAWDGRVQEQASREGYGHLEITVTGDRAVTLASLREADTVLAAGWDAEQLEAGANLKWVPAVSGGVEAPLFPEMVASPLPFTCGKPRFGIPGAEWSLAAMLMVTRRNHFAIGRAKTTYLAGSADDVLLPEDLAGKAVGVLGMGYMGKALAPRAAALGMRVLAATRTPRPTDDGVSESFTADRLPEFLAESDFLVVALPVTPQTKGMVAGPVFENMKDSAFVIDASARATLFDWPALVRAIDGGNIGGFCTQPSGLHPDLGMPGIESDFWQRDNVFVSPCRTTSNEQVAAGLDLFFENMRHFEAGEEMLGIVDRKAGY